MGEIEILTKADETGLLPEEYFQQVPNALLNDLRRGKLIPIDIGVYMVFLQHLGMNQDCWPSNDTVAALLGTSRSSVSRSLSRLEDTGILKRGGYHKFGTRKTSVLVRVEGGKVVSVGHRQLAETLERPTPQRAIPKPQPAVIPARSVTPLLKPNEAERRDSSAIYEPPIDDEAPF